MEILENENILHDDYPVYFDYAYIIDGVPKKSDIQGTVADLKRLHNAKEIRNYKIFAERRWD